MKEIKAIEPTEEKMRSCDLKEEGDLWYEHCNREAEFYSS